MRRLATVYLDTHLIVQAAVEMAGSSSSIAESWQNGDPFSLGMDDWMDSPPLKRTKRPSLSPPHKSYLLNRLN